MRAIVAKPMFRFNIIKIFAAGLFHPLSGSLQFRPVLASGVQERILQEAAFHEDDGRGLHHGEQYREPGERKGWPGG
ncbi:MAG: hypothetical protein WAO02_18770 [Verrucomicrobiia bacterium]